jgi:hypothetical protein
MTSLQTSVWLLPYNVTWGPKASPKNKCSECLQLGFPFPRLDYFNTWLLADHLQNLVTDTLDDIQLFSYLNLNWTTVIALILIWIRVSHLIQWWFTMMILSWTIWEQKSKEIGSLKFTSNHSSSSVHIFPALCRYAWAKINSETSTRHLKLNRT